MLREGPCLDTSEHDISAAANASCPCPRRRMPRRRGRPALWRARSLPESLLGAIKPRRGVLEPTLPDIDPTHHRQHQRGVPTEPLQAEREAFLSMSHGCAPDW